ncbi:hypothetical protein JCM10213_001333 [Rhodosporidiobolus nylandii]
MVTPSAAASHNCAVCTKPATTRCSQCQASWYCGAECQALVWSSHAWLCKQPRQDRFLYPPLTSAEVKLYRKAKLQKPRWWWGDTQDQDLGRLVKKMGWWEGSEEDLITALSAKKDCPIPEPARSAALCVVHWAILMDRAKTSNPAADVAILPQLSPYTLLSQDLCMLQGVLVGPLGGGIVAPDKEADASFMLWGLNEWVRHMLLVQTLRYKAGVGRPMDHDGKNPLKPPKDATVKIRLAIKRLKEVSDKLPVPANLRLMLGNLGVMKEHSTKGLEDGTEGGDLL